MLRRTFQLLSGVGEKTERKLWEAGVTQWADLEGAEPSRLPGRVSRRLEAHLDQLSMANRHLEEGHTSPFERWLPRGELWRLLDEADENVMYLDIETTGLSYPEGRATVVGAHTEAEGTKLLVRGQDLSSEAVEDLIQPAQCLVTFNGRRFDVPWLEREFGVSIDVPHVDLMYAFRKLDITGGLKSIEKQIGLERGEEIDDMGGYEAVKLWRRWERGDHDALERLLSYNRADVVNMKPLAETAYRKLKRDVYEPYAPEGDEEEPVQAEIPLEDER